MGRKRVVLIPPPQERVLVEDPFSLGPLPDNGVAFLAQLGAMKIRVLVKDGRSWIVAGINSWKGSVRPFIARVFDNGFVRDYMAIPPENAELIASSIVELAKEVESHAKEEGEGREEG